MDKFLNESRIALRKLSSFEKIRLVLGNPTCDLDSAVSALVHGYFEYLRNERSGVLVLSMMNIQRKEYRLKTEVFYFLRSNGIPDDLLIFRDDMDLSKLKGELELILVDHHELNEEDISLKDSVVEIIDHRSQDLAWPWHGKNINLQTVASCATLIARNILTNRHEILKDQQICHLLRGTILIDSNNLSKEANRATPLDIEMIETIESMGSIVTNRSQVYQSILDAKKDIRGLTAADLIVKDLKFAYHVPIIGLPILVQDFLELPNSVCSITTYVQSKNQNLAILLGMSSKDDRLVRDLAIFSSKPNDDLMKKIIQELTSTTNPILQLTLAKRTEDGGLILYRQGNLQATRKHILPIVREVMKNSLLSQLNQ